MIIHSLEEFVKAQIPSKQDFSVAESVFRAECLDDAIGGAVRSALFYGSYVRGDHTRASDIDLLLIVRDQVYMDRVSRAVGKAYHQTRVRINPRVVVAPARGEIEQAGVEPTFRRHLETVGASLGFEGEDPFDLLPVDPVPLDVSVYRTVSAYKGTLRNAYLAQHRDEAHKLRFLKKLVEKPFHAMRELLHLTEQGVVDDAKLGVVSTFEDAYPEIATLCDSLKVAVQDYVWMVDRVDSMSLGTRITAYSDSIGAIASTYPVVDAFVTECLQVATRPLRS